MLTGQWLEELRGRISLARLVGKSVAWDSRRSKTVRGVFWACCPFHQEKTPSFKVDDQEGFYYCFSCGAKGDAITWVRETRNIGFREAVEFLANEAGIPVPAAARRSARSDRSAVLHQVLDHSVAFYRSQLIANHAGQPARIYLKKRGISREAVTMFGLGYAPARGNPLQQFLRSRGHTLIDMIEAGVVVRPDDGKPPYDRFRNRVMFPIRNRAGKHVAFGARALSPKARAKYINSPAGLLFDKSRTLYNLGQARAAARRTGELVIVEGYMDVIAMVGAGIVHVAAPLGTAVTQGHLELAWSVAPELLIAFDGDAAGRRAAHRLIDHAFPLLKAGRSLRFILLPDGNDPDTLIKAGGAEAMQKALSRSQPLIDILWERETVGRNFDSPERLAGLDARIAEVVVAIPDNRVRERYRQAMQARCDQAFGGRSSHRSSEDLPERPAVTAWPLHVAVGNDSGSSRFYRRCGVLMADPVDARSVTVHLDFFPDIVLETAQKA
ncbi:MAG: DNA primase [Rhodobacteraceae bacterium]|nr:DNA primase [Paracoccaceae bacterium]